ncbi:hypothetical protein RN001_007202 [Aquatica leii]|uniref:Uncharacterized protein n=1 Tax=Aquatica leii TaxID=1421715 RepID=A0AAN7PBC6_9COLE|nr:hypothetical protein RN001_007202 [Aquatica leii]
MLSYEEEQAKLLRLHEILEEIPSDPESEDDEEDAAGTKDILGTYVLDVNNYLVPTTSDENNVGLTYDNLNSDQHIKFEDSMKIDKVDPPQDESDSDDDTPIAFAFKKCIMFVFVARSANLNMNTFVFVIVCALCFISALAVLPDYIHVCKKNDVDIAQCINNSINHLRLRLPSGIPDLDVPPIEPLKLNEIKLKIGPPSAAIHCNITNLKVWGPSTFVITELKPDLAKNTFYFKIFLPRLHFKGDYDLSMSILLINAKGKGPIEGNFTNYRSEVIMKGRKIMKNDEEYLKFDKIRLRVETGKTNIRLENLFNNDPFLKQLSDDLVNDHSDIFVNEIKPTLEVGLAEKFTDIANKITLKFTHKELFP